MSTPSPPKPSSLIERLQADQEQIRRQHADQTQTLLTQHASGLKKLLRDELRSIKSASEHHRAAVDKVQQETLTRIRWLLLWPVATTVLTSLLILIAVATWTTYRLDQVDQAQAALERASADLATAHQAQQLQPVQPAKKKR